MADFATFSLPVSPPRCSFLFACSLLWNPDLRTVIQWVYHNDSVVVAMRGKWAYKSRGSRENEQSDGRPEQEEKAWLPGVSDWWTMGRWWEDWTAACSLSLCQREGVHTAGVSIQLKTYNPLSVRLCRHEVKETEKSDLVSCSLSVIQYLIFQRRAIFFFMISTSIHFTYFTYSTLIQSVHVVDHTLTLDLSKIMNGLLLYIIYFC